MFLVAGSLFLDVQKNKGLTTASVVLYWRKNMNYGLTTKPMLAAPKGLRVSILATVCGSWTRVPAGTNAIGVTG